METKEVDKYLKSIREMMTQGRINRLLAESIIAGMASPWSGPRALTTRVIYTQPSLATLRRWFQNVGTELRGARFQPIESCIRALEHGRRSRSGLSIGFEYLDFDYNVTRPQALAQMRNRRMRPALYEELICHGREHPDEQRRFVIVALGSVKPDALHGDQVACLGDTDDGRNVHLRSETGYFAPLFYRFLVTAIYE
ncbi:MAG: hypothetical protein WC551_07355 [Patescibacteria group bacterium]